MFRFFKKIRGSFLTENQFTKYLLYVIGEDIEVIQSISDALDE